MSYSILVALDNSPWSTAATDLALWIAGGNDNVRVSGLHVVNVTQIRGRLFRDLAGLLGFEPVVVPEDVEQFFLKSGQQILVNFTEKAKNEGVETSTVLDQGSVTERIHHHGDHNDLVVMGIRGETAGETPGAIGGTADRVARRLSTSVLVVPKTTQAIRRIALGYDGSEGAARALRAAIRFSEITNRPITVIHVSDTQTDPASKEASLAPDTAPLKEASQRLTQANIEHDCIRTTGEPHEALAAECAMAGCDLLVLGYRGRSRVKDIFLGRTTEWLLGNLPTALLVAR